MLDSIYPCLKNRVVRDLAWAILSPSLLDGSRAPSLSSLLQNDYIDDQKSVFSWLQNIDQSPALLLDFIRQRSQSRVGIYFEQLLGFYFSQYPRFELLAQNLQVQGIKRTLGEFDFIIVDNHSGQYFHIESAVKFYLGHIEGSQLARNIKQYDWHHWIGPNKKDSLSLKMHSMINKQLRLSEHAEAHALLSKKNIPIEKLKPRLLLRGRFFCHSAQTTHPQFANLATGQHRWYTLAEFQSMDEENGCYIILPRTHWLSPVTLTDIPTGNTIIQKNNLLKKIHSERLQGIDTWKVAKLTDHEKHTEDKRFFIISE